VHQAGNESAEAVVTQEQPHVATHAEVQQHRCGPVQYLGVDGEEFRPGSDWTTSGIARPE
jgi:hypothetical protein